MTITNRPEPKLSRFTQGLKTFAFIAACALLTGCMASSSSSFVDDLRSVKTEAQQDEMQAVPLEVAEPAGQQPADQMAYATASDPAATGVVPAQQQTAGAYPGPYETPAAQPRSGGLDLYGQRRHASQQGVSLTEEEASQLAALDNDIQNPRPLDANVTGATPRDRFLMRNSRLEPVSGPYSYAPTDPSSVLGSSQTELEAQRRIPAVFAQIDHGECKGGWGPKPRVVNAKRVNPAHPYYMEMRLRQTPMLPVGHVYIAYGRLGANGEPLDEKLVMLSPLGGYAGAAIAAAAPMPGILTPYGDDCKLQPIAAYRVSLSAADFEKLLLRIQQAKTEKPSYHLFQYNCNHFLSDVAASVGIQPPENIYRPSLVYFYEMMDRNEGREVSRDYPGKIATASVNTKAPVR